MKVYITLGEESVDYYIPCGEMEGEGLNSLAAIDITPFLGASGGRMNVMNPETLEWEKKDSYRVPGYVLVPDGCGSLIRFVDNTSVFNAYEGDVYGKDYATETNYSFAYYDDVPVKDPVMPVFGIAHGDGQMAFAAWANQGAEYMDIIVNPDGTKATTYTWAYPRFELNVNYYQLYDEQGSGFFKQMDEIYHYDIHMTYAFLFGDGSDGTAPADYTGMARVYREFLLKRGEMTLPEQGGGGRYPYQAGLHHGGFQKRHCGEHAGGDDLCGGCGGDSGSGDGQGDHQYQLRPHRMAEGRGEPFQAL